MDRTLPIYKQELEKLLKDWGCKKLSSQQLKLWMECNYLPLHIDIAPNEPSYIQSAIHYIMNEFELSNPNYYRPDNYKIAIDFLNCNEQDSEQKRADFIHKCFKFLE
ncbi:MAG: hypothetical protein AAGF83_19390 [Cyanobacteria bacterium P01_G01_bin.67]